MALKDLIRPVRTDASRRTPARRHVRGGHARRGQALPPRRGERCVRRPTSSCASSGARPTARSTRTRCPSSPSRGSPRLPRAIGSATHFSKSHQHWQRRSPRRHWARNLPGLWQAATTTAADRQRIVRLLVKEVVVTVRGESEWADVAIHWTGGISSDHELVRPVQRYRQMADFEGLLNRIDELSQGGQTLTEMAEQLNREGFHPPKRSARFTGVILTRLLAQRGRTGPRPRVVEQPGALGEHEWLLADLARELAMPQATLHRRMRVGWVHARKLPTPGGHWVIWADADELDRMGRIRTCPPC